MLINMAVFGATVSYVLMMVSHIVLRRPRAGPAAALPDAGRGGDHRRRAGARRGRRGRDVPRRRRWRAGDHWRASSLVALAYFGLYSRHHLVASAPEEEFAALERPRPSSRGTLTSATRRRSAGTPTSSPRWRRCSAKATPARSGDQLAGVAAESDEERVAAQIGARRPAAGRRSSRSTSSPYEDDEVTRLILDTHDAGGVRAGRAPDRRRVPRLAAVVRGDDGGARRAGAAG